MTKEEENGNRNQEERLPEQSEAETGREWVLKDSIFVVQTTRGVGMGFIGGVRKPANKGPGRQ